MIFLLLQLIEPTATLKDGAFIVEGTTDLPDGARLTLHVDHPRDTQPVRLAVTNVEVKEGKFRGELPVFAGAAFPGTYTVGVTYDPMLQRAGADLPFRTLDVKAVADGDEIQARLDYLRALHDAIASMGTVAREWPEGWKARLDGGLLTFSARPETRILSLVEIAEENVDVLYHKLEELSAGEGDVESFDRALRDVLAKLELRMKDPREIPALLRQLETALEKGEPIEALMLRLAALLPEEKYRLLAEAAGDREAALRVVRELQ